jgi:hypothetical protein
MSSNHDLIIKNWGQSAEYNRIRLNKAVQSEHNPHGKYHVRMTGSRRWVPCDSPPEDGATEWLFIDSSGMPLFYWNREKNSVVLIG